MNVSPRTAELARHAMDVVLRRTRHNGLPMPPDIVRALRELESAADVSPGRQNFEEPVAAPTLISVIEAARRLGVSTRTVERRVSAGQLPANRVGRNLQIIWTEEGTTMAAQSDATPAESEAPTRYRVTAPLITVKTGMLAGIIPGRSGWTVVTLYRHALVPVDAPAADIERLFSNGLIEAVPA